MYVASIVLPVVLTVAAVGLARSDASPAFRASAHVNEMLSLDTAPAESALHGTRKK